MNSCTITTELSKFMKRKWRISNLLHLTYFKIYMVLKLKWVGFTALIYYMENCLLPISPIISRIIYLVIKIWITLLICCYCISPDKFKIYINKPYTMKYDLIVCPILVLWFLMIVMVAVRNEVGFIFLNPQQPIWSFVCKYHIYWH